MGRLERLINFLNTSLIFIAGICLMGMMCLACANMFLRAVWLPVSGTYEIVGFLGALVASFALGYTQLKRAHTAVDILVSRLSKGAQGIVEGISHLISMILFALVAWRTALWATTLWRTGEVTETLRIIYFPFTYGLVLGAATLSLVLFLDFLKTIKSFAHITTGAYRLFVDSIRAHREG